MRLATLRRSRPDAQLPGIHGVARVQPVGADVADLARRAKRGDIAVIDQLDLDAASARLLVSAGVSAVVNAAPSISGRYPARGAQTLVDAGIAVLDRAGPEVLRLLRDGDKVRLDGSLLHNGDDVLARGEPLSGDDVTRLTERARSGLAVQLEAFAANTAEALRHDHALLLDGDGIPELSTRLAGRNVVVVSCGPSWEDDLAGLKPWMKTSDPVLVAVEEAADALRGLGWAPDLIVGNPDLVSEEALLCGAEIVVRADRDGRAGGVARASALGSRTVVFPVTGTGEDAALLLADAHDAALIVAVGSRASVTDFVDRARPDLAGTFLARLKVGTRLMDAASVAHVYRKPAPTWPLWLLVVLLVAGVAATAVLAGDATPVGQWRDDLIEWVRTIVNGATT